MAYHDQKVSVLETQINLLHLHSGEDLLGAVIRVNLLAVSYNSQSGIQTFILKQTSNLPVTGFTTLQKTKLECRIPALFSYLTEY